MNAVTASNYYGMQMSDDERQFVATTQTDLRSAILYTVTIYKKPDSLAVLNAAGKQIIIWNCARDFPQRENFLRWRQKFSKY